MKELSSKITIVPKTILAQESPFIQFLDKIYPISEDAKEYLNEKTVTYRISQNDHLIESGEVYETLYLVEKGVLRCFVKSFNNETTTKLIAEQEIVTSVINFALLQPCRENIQAIEDCNLAGLKHEHVLYMYAHFPEIKTIAGTLHENYIQALEEYIHLVRMAKGVNRYKHLLKTKSELLYRFPCRILASYLGVAPETYSRYRGSVIKKMN